MSKVAIVYWSGTGNTQKMADAIAAGAQKAGAEVSMFGPSEFDRSQLNNFSAIAFGCPSMGVEVLEETEFEPMFADLESALMGKSIALFGSYGWGDGEWMRNWVERCQDDGARLITDEGLIVQETPNDTQCQVCQELGAKLANS